MYKTLRILIPCASLAALCSLPMPVDAQFLARFTNPQVEVTMTHPPGYPLTLERAAVVPSGDGCPEELSDAVISMFSENGVELLDRQNFEAILAEQDLGLSGLVSPESAAEMGRLVGSAVLVMVSTNRCAEETRPLQDPYRTFDGKRGVKFITKTESFLKGSVRVIDLATGRIFASRPIEGRAVLENTSFEGQPEAPSQFDARDQALRQAVWEVRKMFFTWEERRELYFFNDDECNLRAAFKLLQIGDIEGAAAQSVANLDECKSADLKPKFLARAYYNLGMTRFLQSKFEEALDHLEKAFRMDGGDIIAESIAECRRAQLLATEMAKLEDSVEVAPVLASRSSETGAGAAGGDSAERRLLALDGLLEKGLISREEYEKKRGEILSDI